MDNVSQILKSTGNIVLNTLAIVGAARVVAHPLLRRFDLVDAIPNFPVMRATKREKLIDALYAVFRIRPIVNAIMFQVAACAIASRYGHGKSLAYFCVRFDAAVIGAQTCKNVCDFISTKKS
ncbi:MAG: hypothetical protein SP4CHLAM5_09840 [Chlamydiia bacterium]|nr:hypothetical protein [Chlamydiia bacterium]MCH9618842.1 hypothetical protein [Chlamydiia bacterium]MCH9624356.1 hypothetical protein [Chlamydiia bacterium]